MSDEMKENKRGEEPELQAGSETGQPEVQLMGPARYSMAGIVQADHVEISKGAAGVVVADRASVERGYTSITVARGVSVHQGGSQVVVAGEVHLEQAGSGVMVARRVTASSTWVGVMVAGSVEGDPRPVIDTRGAAAMGMAIGALVGLSMLLRAIFRHG
ncbi:MAG TPA: hypothetical protein VFD42_04055 [Chloroflexota bacterium]|nr:hypothetical protein [Chloroflexota bacterium]